MSAHPLCRIESMFPLPAGISLTATNNGGGPTSVGLDAGTYCNTTLTAHMQTKLNTLRPGSGGATWSVTQTAGQNTIAMSSGTYTLAMPALLEEMLGFEDVAAVSTATGARVACGVFVPECPLMAPVDPFLAVKAFDKRDTVSPRGQVFSFVSAKRWSHRDFMFQHVPRHRTWVQYETVGGTWEQFVRDSQMGDGHPWFGLSSPVRIWDQLGREVGGGEVASWQLPQLPGLERVSAHPSTPNGMLYVINIPDLVGVF